MQWFFALNDSATEWFEPMIKVGVHSAIENTRLQPVCLFDGEPNHLTSWLDEHGVTVIRTSVPFRDELFSPETIATNEATPYRPDHAAGAFLRTQAFRYAESDIFLYTDCDVMFLDGAISVAPRTSRIAAVPEMTGPNSFNSGVMLINKTFFAHHHDALVSYIRRHGFYHKDKSSYDQCFLNEYFSKQWDRLSLGLNWRPVQGVNEDASIIHFHGPKPTRIQAILSGNALDAEAPMSWLIEQARDAYEIYTKQFYDYLSRC